MICPPPLIWVKVQMNQRTVAYVGVTIAVTVLKSLASVRHAVSANIGECFLKLYTDIDECQESVCDRNGNCTNTIGSFECTCNIGFTGSGLECEGGWNMTSTKLHCLLIPHFPLHLMK